ncbi:GGDEF domain-containing protein [Gynuella sunshinyii]|uniref:diguanylate cyclase n=1 Tax=Gynuella sunshinyii YC6258 TaxID=1445510 RepID=A0A0C5VQB3_9GAMM|nr:GGDEF domain-containing protein [Gynuella sunshinyii]AJQ96456.1 GGDEF domain [Gynuella sunshinyii YC6258]
MSTNFQPPVSINEQKTLFPKIDQGSSVELGSITKSDALRDLRLRMSLLLQTTLDTERLVRIVYEEICKAVEVHGINYRYPGMQISIMVGRQNQHKVTYRLTANEDTYGEIVFCRSRRFKEEELMVLESLLDLFIYPLKNSLQYRRALACALTDSLTGVGNRQALMKTLQRELDLADRHSLELSILMIDIDNFKAINDDHGHLTGDTVLKKAAQNIVNVIRSSDMCFRFGGEEFVVILSNTGVEQAQVIGKRINESISEGIEAGIHKNPITVSIGAALLQTGMDIEKLLQSADDAMYIAKATGKNKTIIAKELVS